MIRKYLSGIRRRQLVMIPLGLGAIVAAFGMGPVIHLFSRLLKRKIQVQ